jgi:hypothetical protein
VFVVAIGGYDAFFDEPGLPFCQAGCPMLNTPNAILLCHDCAVKLWTAFPVFEQKYGRKGLHPYSELPCCKYGWRMKYNNRGEVEGVEYGDGSFEPSL